jgi:predicted nucleotidyltransferase
MTTPFVTASQAELRQRQQAAIAFAQQCTVILTTQYHAQQVIPFGSAVGDSPWHWDSDLDLAVVGLSQPDWLRAYDELAAIAPPWLKLDLIQLETVAPEVRGRILKEHPMIDNKYLALKEHLEDELVALDRTAKALEAAIKRAKLTLDEYDVRALASYINDFYRRCERISERVAVTLDGGLPQQINWHQALLRQVAEPGGDDRPPLWSGALLLDLDQYRAFRHVIHHKYGEDLKANYVLGLAELAPPMALKVHQAVEQFNQWLVGRST